MENRLYVSYLTVPGASGNYDINLTTYDASPNITLTLTITGSDPSDSEDSLARKAYDQINTILIQNSLNYSGEVTLFPGTPSNTFRVTRTNHVLCFYSEAQFDIDIDSDTIGSIIRKDTDPYLTTVSKMSNQSNILGQDLTDLTNSQIADLIGIISSKIVQALKNPIVMSTYRHEAYTNWNYGTKLAKLPIVSIDPPYIRRPDLFTFLTTGRSTNDPLSIYNVDYKTGWMMYRYSQDLLLSYEPFDYNNNFRLTYVAGERQIPAIIQSTIADLVNAVLNDSDVAKLSGGTFSIEPKHFSHIFNEKMQFLKRYVLNG